MLGATAAAPAAASCMTRVLAKLGKLTRLARKDGMNAAYARMLTFTRVT